MFIFTVIPCTIAFLAWLSQYALQMRIIWWAEVLFTAVCALIVAIFEVGAFELMVSIASVAKHNDAVLVVFYAIQVVSLIATWCVFRSWRGTASDEDDEKLSPSNSTADTADDSSSDESFGENSFSEREGIA